MLVHTASKFAPMEYICLHEINIRMGLTCLLVRASTLGSWFRIEKLDSYPYEIVVSGTEVEDNAPASSSSTSSFIFFSFYFFSLKLNKTG